ncbi:MAG: MATE family efflux transporter [Acidobacteria bacterium]|nr:MAG: MATE family efflux transporter [Acidobacteriota bacterium]
MSEINVAAPAREASLWSTVRESIAGSHRGEYTDGPIGRAILLLAIPMVLELVLESVFAVVDVFFVSRLGADAVATVGLTESILTIVYALAIGLSVGAIGLIASRSARRLLTIMGATPDVLAHSSYAAVVLGFNGVIVMLFLINAVFRGAGDAAIAMRVLWIANAINICLDPCFIFGLGPFPRLGVTGAAVATTTGRGVGVLVQLFFLSRGDGRIVIRRKHLGLDLPVMLNMLRLSGSAVGQTLIATTSWVGVVRILASFGSVAVAGCTIAIRIVMFVLLPSWGLSNAAATLVGQNLGAGKPERAEASVWRACLYNSVVLGVISLVFIVWAEGVVAQFTSEPAVSAIAARGLRIISGGFVFYASGYVLSQSFNGAGDTVTPTLINLFCFWLGEVPLAYLLARPLGLGPPGVFWAIAIAFSVMTLVSAWLFRRGSWKLKRV